MNNAKGKCTIVLDYRKIGQRTRKYRKALGLSQDELSEKVDISTTHLSHIETGSTKLSLPVLVKLASALNIHPDQLLLDICDNDQGKAYDSEILQLLDSCTSREMLIVADVVSAILETIRKNN